jgi:ABC-2 type transport system ATP-binding protein
MTIILTTHYMEEAESLSDRIGIMSKGKLVAIGTVKELLAKTEAKNFEDAFIEIAGKGGQK